jgi:transposase
MASVFWDRNGVLMVEFMQQGTTIMSEVYCKLLKKLHTAFQNKRYGMLMSGVVFLHDSAYWHTAGCRSALLEHFNLELLDQPPYSPDLALSNYHLFTYLKTGWDHNTWAKMRSWLKVSKRGSVHRQQISLTEAYILPTMTSASILAVTTLRSRLSICIFCI